MRTRQPAVYGHIPLAFASVCLTCEEVFDLRGLTCGNCASETFVPLEVWIGSLQREAGRRFPWMAAQV